MQSAFRQTYPMEIIVSDQGSKDRTLEVAKQQAAGYTGRHKVTILECPETGHRGMAGLNSHLNWLHETIDHDVQISCSADDSSMPERTAKVIEAFEKTGADMVMTQQLFVNPDMTPRGITAHPNKSGFVSVADCIYQRVGGSSSCAWSRDFYKAAGPVPLLVGPDIYLPTLACARRGLYFIHEPLHAYIEHAKAANTGLEGRMRAAAGNEAELARLAELACFQIGAGYLAVIKKMKQWDAKEELFTPVMDQMMCQAVGWYEARMTLTLGKITPTNLEV